MVTVIHAVAPRRPDPESPRTRGAVRVVTPVTVRNHQQASLAARTMNEERLRLSGLLSPEKVHRAEWEESTLPVPRTGTAIFVKFAEQIPVARARFGGLFLFHPTVYGGKTKHGSGALFIRGQRFF
jgi:hypothetical protein